MLLLFLLPLSSTTITIIIIIRLTPFLSFLIGSSDNDSKSKRITRLIYWFCFSKRGWVKYDDSFISFLYGLSILYTIIGFLGGSGVFGKNVFAVSFFYRIFDFVFGIEVLMVFIC